MKTKACTKCEIEKPLDQFSKGNNKDGFNSWCKDCMRIYHKEYRKNPKVREKNLINGRKYFLSHRDKCLAKSRKWKQNNMEKIREYKRKYCNLKQKTDINFQILHNLRTRVICALKGNPKLQTTMKLVSCSIEQLREHLQKQFKEGMTWNNYGKWHIDHIRPCCSFDLSKKSEQKKCFHYTNLQPLWAKENQEKKDKILNKSKG